MGRPKKGISKPKVRGKKHPLAVSAQEAAKKLLSKESKKEKITGRGGPGRGQGRKSHCVVVPEDDKQELDKLFIEAARDGIRFMSALINDNKAPINLRLEASEYVNNKIKANAMPPKEDSEGDGGPEFDGVAYVG